MSGPAGAGHGRVAQKGAKFANVVGSLRRKKEGSSTSTTASVPDGVGPSQGIPGTGLKRNTKEWKDEHENGKENGYQKGERRGLGGVGGRGRRRGSESSSSSIPSNATGSGSEDREVDSNHQEGPEGRGPGKHEKRIMETGHGGLVESPLEDEFPNTSHGPKDREDDIWGKEQREDGYGKSNGYGKENGLGGEEGHVRETGYGWENGHAGENGHGRENGHGDESGIDREEKMMGRKEGRNKKLKDETGRMPDDLPGVKEEQAPGPRNEIFLDPRISHIHVSSSAFYLTFICRVLR